MVYKNETTRDSEKELSMQILTRAADDIASCGNDLLIVAEVIAQSCQMIGSTNADFRKILSSRASHFKVLADLYKTRSKSFESIVTSLEGTVQQSSRENTHIENN